MYAHITPMRFHGKALDQHQIRTAESVRGDIVVSHRNVAALGRYSDVATVKNGDGLRDDLVPPLYDCRLAHTGPNGFVLSGLQFDGPVGFAQAWYVTRALTAETGSAGKCSSQRSNKTARCR